MREYAETSGQMPSRRGAADDDFLRVNAPSFGLRADIAHGSGRLTQRQIAEKRLAFLCADGVAQNADLIARLQEADGDRLTLSRG